MKILAILFALCVSCASTAFAADTTFQSLSALALKLPNCTGYLFGQGSSAATCAATVPESAISGFGSGVSAALQFPMNASGGLMGYSAGTPSTLGGVYAQVGYVAATGLGSAANVAASVVSASSYGVVNDATCAIDQTTAMQNAITAAAGQKLVLPSGANICLKTATSTLKISSTLEIDGQGATLTWAAPASTAVAPILDVLATAPHTVIHNLNFNANFVGVTYADSTYFGTNPWGDIAVSIQADDFVGRDLFAQNGFDNCFGAAKISSNTAVAGSPKRVQLANINTKNCGAGIHSASMGGPGKIGAGIDLGSASASSVVNATDYSSYGSYINDIGASGTNNNWTNITSFYSQIDTVTSGAHSPPAFYNGSQYNSFSNISIIAPAAEAVWSDFYGLGSTWNNVNIYAPGKDCIRVKGPGSWKNVSCANPSFASSGAVAAIIVDSSGGAFADFEMVGLDISTAGSSPAYAIQGNGSNAVTGRIVANALPGTDASTNNLPSGLQIESQNAGGHGFGTPVASYPWDFYGATRLQSSAAHAVYTSCAFGDMCDTTSARVTDVTGKNLAIGYDPTNGFWAIQGLNPWISAIPIALNPSGGAVLFIPVAIASLPTCNSAAAGAYAAVNNGVASPTYMGAVSTTGTSTDSVFCNGSGWVYH